MPARGLYETPTPSSQELADPMSTAEDGCGTDGASADGHGLGDNLAVQAARADWLYHSRRFQARSRQHNTHPTPTPDADLGPTTASMICPPLNFGTNLRS